MSGERRRLLVPRPTPVLLVLALAVGLISVVGIGASTVARATGLGAGSDPGERVLADRSARVAPERQADLVAGEDRRITQALPRAAILEQTSGERPYRVRASGQFTLVLTARHRPYSWDDLRKLSADKLIPRGRGVFLLREHVLVAPGATLSISPDRPLELRMASGPEGFVSIVTDGGRIRLNGTATAPITLTSWDESRGRADTDLGDGRAYLRAGGQLVVANTTFSRLGFWSGRTGGVSILPAAQTPTTDLRGGAVTAAGGEPQASRVDSHTDLLPAGKLPSVARDESGSYSSEITGSTMVGNAFGLFVSGASGLRVSDSRIGASLVDGLVLHRNVDAATITGVEVRDSAVDGVVLNRDVEGTVLTRLEVSGSGRDGVVLAGAPVTTGPSAGGGDVRPFGNNVLSTSRSIGNGRIGVYVAGGIAITVQGNTISGGHSGIVVAEAAREVSVSSNTVKDVRVNGIQVRDGARAELLSNAVVAAATGIHVRDAVVVLRGNSVSAAALHGLTFVGRVAGSVADGNLLRGTGSSALDTVRVEGEAPRLSGTDDSGWTRTVTTDSLLVILLHPLTLIWLGIGVVLLLLARPRRVGARSPYRADPLLSSAGPAGGRPLIPAQSTPGADLRQIALSTAAPTATATPAPAAASTAAPAKVAAAAATWPNGTSREAVPGPGADPHPAPVRRNRPVPAARSGRSAVAAPTPARRMGPLERAQASDRFMHWEHVPHENVPSEPDRRPWPGAAMPGEPAAGRAARPEINSRRQRAAAGSADLEPAGSQVIDMAIAESRRDTPRPRRRRVVGR